MDSNVTSSAMSASLLARNVYCVCFADRDSLDLLRGELALAREKFFTNRRKTMRVGKKEVIRGFDGKLQGKLSRRAFYWNKTANKVTGTGRLVLEEAFDQKGGYVLVNRDFRNVIASRVFFDKSLIWLKSEYYEPWDSHNARVIFKPVDSDDLVERFDWDAARKRYRSTMLFPVPYLEGSARQSLLNAQFGEPKLVVSTGEGLFCYCPKKEAEARKKALEDLKDGTLVLLPAWEVKEGSVAGEKDEDGPSISFSSLEEYARVEEPQEQEATPLTEAPAPPFQEAEEFSPETESENTDGEPSAQQEVQTTTEAVEHTPNPEEITGETSTPDSPEDLEEPAEQEPVTAETAAPQPATDSEEQLPSEPDTQPDQELEPVPVQDPESQEILEAARKAAEQPEETKGEFQNQEPSDRESLEILQAARQAASLAQPESVSSQELAELRNAPAYRGELREGKPWGRGRTEQTGGLTSYEGEFREGKREGFGTYYYKDGNLCYAGSWKNDKKDGLGVSFRDSDHALHIARWKEGAPEEFVSLFDKDGNLRYGGRIEHGKKQGPGVSYNTADGTIFVGKWLDGQPTGIGSAFDRDGNLVYYGGWKNGQRNGHGTEFDQNGAIVFDGEWKDGKYFNGILYQKRNQEGLPDTDTASPTWEL